MQGSPFIEPDGQLSSQIIKDMFILYIDIIDEVICGKLAPDWREIPQSVGVNSVAEFNSRWWKHGCSGYS
jgi:hypothetical protein